MVNSVLTARLADLLHCLLHSPSLSLADSFLNYSGFNVYEFVVAGGWLMVPILMCSVAAAAICVERLWSLSASKIAPANLIAQVWLWLKNDEFSVERMKQLKMSSPLGYILDQVLSNS